MLIRTSPAHVPLTNLQNHLGCKLPHQLAAITEIHFAAIHGEADNLSKGEGLPLSSPLQHANTASGVGAPQPI